MMVVESNNETTHWKVGDLAVRALPLTAFIMPISNLSLSSLIMETLESSNIHLLHIGVDQVVMI